MFSKPKVAHNKPVPKLSQRIAEEAQLLAEEKWIISALKKIKAQRNGLQIERLHLEDMRAKLLACVAKVSTPEERRARLKFISTESPYVTPPETFEGISLDDYPRMEIPDMDDDETCNNEELNLSVTNPVFNTDPYAAMGDEEEDDEDMENCVLDIDLLMSSK